MRLPGRPGRVLVLQGKRPRRGRPREVIWLSTESSPGHPATSGGAVALPGARTGAFASQFIDPCEPEQIQPNGVDLRVERLFMVTSAGHLAPGGTIAGDREEVPWRADHRLAPGAYVVRYREKITIPAGHVGQVFPRSSLLRNGGTLFSALWDQGYEGRGEALLVLWQALILPPGARIGQLVLYPADRAPGYQGQYQGENTEDGA